VQQSLIIKFVLFEMWVQILLFTLSLWDVSHSESLRCEYKYNSLRCESLWVFEMWVHSEISKTLGSQSDLHPYGVALVSRIDWMIGRFCKRALSKRLYSAKETYHFIDPTDRSHPISLRVHISQRLWDMWRSHSQMCATVTSFCNTWDVWRSH